MPERLAVFAVGESYPDIISGKFISSKDMVMLRDLRGREHRITNINSLVLSNADIDASGDEVDFELIRQTCKRMIGPPVGSRELREHSLVCKVAF